MLLKERPKEVRRFEDSLEGEEMGGRAVRRKTGSQGMGIQVNKQG